MNFNSRMSTTFQGIFESNLNLVWIGLVTVCYWVGLSYYKGQTRKLSHVPTVGPSLPILSYFGTLKFIFNARDVVKTGIKTWPKSMFKVPDMFEWIVVMTEPSTIEELRKAPENVLSLMEAVDESLQTKFTLGPHISENPYHIPIIRAQLTRALPQLVPDVYEEVIDAFREYIPPTEDWSSVKVLETMMKVVARASNRIFVGLPLCRDPDFLELNVQFTVDVVKTGAILRMVPHFLRPLVNSLLSNVPTRTRHGLKHLEPVIAARRKEREEKGNNYTDKSVDLLTWLMDEAKGEETTDWYLTSRILTVNFAAIHTSSMTFAHAFYYLAANLEYMKPLREEVEDVLKRFGTWSKEALDEMHKIDSFIKESQRINPLGSLLLNRVAVKDYTFSDGTTVPAGTTVSVAASESHYDEKVYADPMKFDGFRFLKMKEHDSASATQGSDKKYDMVGTSVNSLPFGHGRHACPGRFFAACELKLMFAHLVITYDIKLEKEGVRPPDMWVVSACVPNPTAEVLFRKRKEE